MTRWFNKSGQHRIHQRIGQSIAELPFLTNFSYVPFYHFTNLTQLLASPFTVYNFYHSAHLTGIAISPLRRPYRFYHFTIAHLAAFYRFFAALPFLPFLPFVFSHFYFFRLPFYRPNALTDVTILPFLPFYLYYHFPSLAGLTILPFWRPYRFYHFIISPYYLFLPFACRFYHCLPFLPIFTFFRAILPI